jgi:serine/threonine protein kinase
MSASIGSLRLSKLRLLPPLPFRERGSEGAVSSLPTSFVNGRYSIQSFLGEGGKKKVYDVHDATLDRDVAFGLIKADELDVASRQRITREAQAMARLGDHPNIMPIFDLGDESGQPFMVQPLMAGGDVGALLDAAEDRRAPLKTPSVSPPKSSVVSNSHTQKQSSTATSNPATYGSRMTLR